MPDRIARHLNGLAPDAARAVLGRCCGARHWVGAMLAARPFASDAELLALAEQVWWKLGRADWLEAFAAHSRIGVRAGDAWARREQAGGGGLGEGTRPALAPGDRGDEKRFRDVFLVCATAETAEEMRGGLAGPVP